MYYNLVSMYDLEEGETTTVEKIIDTLKKSAVDSASDFDYIPINEEEIDNIFFNHGEYIITCESDWQYRMYRVVSDTEIEFDRKELEYERRELIRGLL